MWMRTSVFINKRMSYKPRGLIGMELDKFYGLDYTSSYFPAGERLS